MGITAAAMFSTVGASTAATAVGDAAFASALAGTGTFAAADAVATAGITGSMAGSALAGLGTVAKWVNIGGTLMQGFGNLEAGKAGKQEAEFEAKQLKDKQNSTMAAAENQMLIENRNKDLTMSKVTANAAAGGGALDPSVVNILGDLETQGQMNAQNTLYNGAVRSTDFGNDATMARFRGNQENSAGEIGAVSSLFKGTASMFDKYNGDGGYR